MKIAFDGQIFIDQEYGGISRYICELTRELDRQPDMQAKIFAPVHRNSYLQSFEERLGGNHRKLPRWPYTTRLLRGISDLVTPALLRGYAPDILHWTYYDIGFGLPKKIRTVITVHDLIYELFPDLFPDSEAFCAQMRQTVRQCDHVICISHQTRKDLLERFNLDPAKISVVHHGFEISAEVMPPASGCAALLKGRPYVLYVGSRAAHKNFGGLLQAYSNSNLPSRGVQLVCFGGGEFSAAEVAQIVNLKFETEMVVQRSGSDAVLQTLYKHAALFVYPSLYEGFGFPPLEAMSFDCPVACSSSGSIPEVAGDAALYFDPERIEEMQNAIEKLIDSPSLANKLRILGRERCRSFSWEKCALETAAAYKKLT